MNDEELTAFMAAIKKNFPETSCERMEPLPELGPEPAIKVTDIPEDQYGDFCKFVDFYPRSSTVFVLDFVGEQVNSGGALTPPYGVILCPECRGPRITVDDTWVSLDVHVDVVAMMNVMRTALLEVKDVLYALREPAEHADGIIREALKPRARAKSDLSPDEMARIQTVFRNASRDGIDLENLD
jgi:hypothetical protein